jgi:uncharacterized protein YabN with tetrapyrrole methylase and pyrophosphatase domain
MKKIADFNETFEAIEGLSLETTHGRITSEKDVVLEVTIGYTAEKDYGYFELYDVKTGGDKWYAEGGLWFDNEELTDYDGVFELPPFVWEYLEQKGFNVDYVKD